MTVEASITINGSKAAVWAATTDIARFAELLSGVEKIEVVERPPVGLVGLKWKETRKLFGESATVEKWITEAKEGDYYKTRAEQGGFVFITTNRVSGSDGSVRLTGIHETQPQGFAAKLKSLPMVFFKGVIRKAILKDLKDVKQAVVSTTIYVYLQDEGTDVWRPISAVPIHDDVYRITGAPPNDTESWELSTGDKVRCRETAFADGNRGLVAYEKVASDTPIN